MAETRATAIRGRVRDSTDGVESHMAIVVASWPPAWKRADASLWQRWMVEDGRRQAAVGQAAVGRVLARARQLRDESRSHLNARLRQVAPARTLCQAC